jgi:hypothetical protein
MEKEMRNEYEIIERLLHMLITNLPVFLNQNKSYLME